MNIVYFTICDTGRELLKWFPVTWQSLLANAAGVDHVVVLNGGAQKELLDQIPNDFEIRNFELHRSNTVLYTDLDRAKWEHSHEGSDDDFVLFLDARDMLFQRNPFEDILGYNLVTSGEGAIHAFSPWNASDQIALRNNFAVAQWPNTDKWEVVCSGVIGGRRKAAHLALLAEWTLASQLTKGGYDQSAWNYFWNRLFKNIPGSWMCDPNTSDWCLSGHGQVMGDIKPDAEWKCGNIISGTTGRPYAIVHQWERTEWCSEIQNRWQR